MIRDFYDNHLRPNYDAWVDEPRNQRLAKNAVGDANTMAARVYHYWIDLDPSQLPTLTNTSCWIVLCAD